MNQKIKDNLPLILSITTLLTLIGFITYHFIEKYERRQMLNAQKESAIKFVHDDIVHTYGFFKERAFLWNLAYAKLTLNHTRDTITYPKYTVREMGRKHESLITEIDYLKKQVDIWAPLPVEYLIKEFDVDYNTGHLFSTYRFRDEFFDLTQDLESAFANIIQHQNPTDTVLTYVNGKEAYYSTYFRTLQRMDRIYLDLTVFRYPKDLKYITNTSKNLINVAKRMAFQNHLYELQNKHDLEKNIEDYGYSSHANLCNINSGELTTYVTKVNGNKVLSLIASEIDLAQTQPDETQRVLKELAQCTARFRSNEEGGNYYYIVTANQWYFSRNMETGFRPLSDKVKDELMTFYDDESQEYYILGGYEALKVFYPNQVKEQ